MGLDPRIDGPGQIPDYLVRELMDPNKIILEFNKSLIDNVHDLIPVISLIALVFLFIDAYSSGVLIEHVFFITHLFVLGYAVFKSVYVPRGLGIFLIIGAFCYIITEYGAFILPTEVYELLLMIVVLPAALAELSLGIWLLIKSSKLDEIFEQIVK